MAFADLKNDLTKLTAAELRAYEKARDEIQQVLEIAAEREAAGFVKGETSGFLKGKRDALLRLLARARLALTEDQRARIMGCADPALLDRWVDNVLGAKSIDDVLS